MMQTLVEKLENVKAEMDGHVLVVTMNRPKALNALNNQTLDELQAVFDMAAQDAEIYGVIILSLIHI